MFHIYVIQNKLNNKIYVGKTSNPIRRYAEHRGIANGAKPREYSLIHAAIKKYGIDNFIFSVIEEWENEQDSYNAEEFWIEFFRTDVSKFGKEAGYNVNAGGRGAKSGALNPMFGKTHSPEVKAKMSAQRSGALNANFGKHFSDETKQIMSKKKQNIYLGENNPRAKFTNDQAENIRSEWNAGGISMSELALKFNVRRNVIWKILRNKTYRRKV